MASYLNILVNLIVQMYFNDSLCILQAFDKRFTEDIIQINQVPTVLVAKEADDVIADKHKFCRHFLLHYDNTNEAFARFEHIIKTESNGFYNNRKYVLIINEEDDLTAFFNSTALYFVRDVLVVYNPNGGHLDVNPFQSFDDDVRFDLYTHKYIGFEGNNERILLDQWFSVNVTFKYGNYLFPDKVTNQDGRELRAPCFQLIPYALCTFEESIGNEHNVILKYAAKYNYTLNIFNITDDYYGWLGSDWTGDGYIFSLIDDSDEYVDILYGGFPGFKNWAKHLDRIESVTYTYEVSVLLPKIKFGFFMFLEVFKMNIWSLIVLAFLLTRLLIWLKKKYMTQSPLSSSVMSLTLYGLLINQPAPMTSDIRRSKFMKYILILMLVSNVLLGTGFNSRLSSVMVSPIYVEDIQTLKELSESHYKLLFFDKYYEILSLDQREVYKTLYEKINMIPKGTEFSEMVTSEEYAVARYRRSSGEYFETTEHLIEMYGKFKPITPELFTDHYYFLLRKNSMHTPELAHIVASADEAGLMDFWEEDALRRDNMQLFQMQIQDYDINNDNSDLTLHHLKGIFAFWGIGMAISLLCFLKELDYGHNIFPYQN